LLRNTLLLSALIFAALQLWRPCFFLTDDNLDGGLPFFTEMGNHLLGGHSPFVSDHLFGGNYNMLRDPSFLSWHPLYMLVSLLAATPFHNTIIDVNAFAFLMLATAGFVVLGDFLRREMALAISNGWITFYALSFTYTMIALTTGASWLNFLGSYSALPWLTLGILQKTWRGGVALVALFSLHQMLGGHPEPNISSTIFMSLFALGVSFTNRSWLPLINWLGGYAAALMLMSPIIVEILGGFSHSFRAQGVSLEDMQNYNIPAGQFMTSIFAGMAIWLVGPHAVPHVTYTIALGASAAAWCMPATLLSRAPWRRIEIVIFLLLIFGAVLICRPVFISEIMTHLPLFRSMRWPFRELVQFQFFFHLFLLVRPPGGTATMRRGLAILGTFLLVIPMALCPLPPTFNAMNWDRELVLTGGTERYWAQVRSLLKPTDRVVVLLPLKIYESDRFEEPYSLLGTNNYAELAGFVNAWGYSPTVPLDQTHLKTFAYYPFGAYQLEQKEALMAERPELKFITLESLHPLKITLSSQDGPTIDLTPFVPERKSKAYPVGGQN
jgi:hypothetical protein